jgi:DNA polymerase-3 subunit epsilon
MSGTILILDTETSSLLPSTGQVLEVACALWSIRNASLITAQSWLVAASSNEAEDINGISVDLLSMGQPWVDVEEEVLRQALGARCIVAHNAPFDRLWFKPEMQALSWVDSMDDVEWPKKTGRSLAALALGHGVGMVDAHRALPDVLTLVRVFDRVAEMGCDVEAMITRAMRPKVLVRALVSFAHKDLAKEMGFRWFPEEKEWRKRVFEEERATFKFETREVVVEPDPTLYGAEPVEEIT